MDSETLSKIFGDGAADAVGSSLVATGAAGMVLFLYIRNSDDLRSKLDVISDAGLTKIFRERASKIKSEYDVRLQSAKQIDVIGWGLSSFREDYGAQFRSWSTRASVRILIVAPDHPTADHSLADLRDAEERRPIGDIRRQVEAFRALIDELGLTHSPSFQVRLMHAIPAVNLLRAGDEIFWGPYLMGEQSRNTPTMLVQRGGYLYDVLSKHFEEVWLQGQRLS